MPGEEMDYQFREIRKGECTSVLAFASEQGCKVESKALRHHLSLTVKSSGELAAVALCIEQKHSQYVIEIAQRESLDQALITELTDRCLRKMQSQGIASARINSPSQEATQSIWQQANWLDRIEETPPPPPEVSPVESAVQSPQAA